MVFFCFHFQQVENGRDQGIISDRLHMNGSIIRVSLLLPKFLSPFQKNKTRPPERLCYSMRVRLFLNFFFKSRYTTSSLSLMEIKKSYMRVGGIFQSGRLSTCRRNSIVSRKIDLSRVTTDVPFFGKIGLFQRKRDKQSIHRLVYCNKTKRHFSLK